MVWWTNCYQAFKHQREAKEWAGTSRKFHADTPVENEFSYFNTNDWYVHCQERAAEEYAKARKFMGIE